MDEEPREAIEKASRAAVALARTGDVRGAASLIRLAYAACPTLPPDDPLRRIVTQNAAAIVDLAGDTETAIAMYREAVGLGESTNDLLFVGVAWDRLFELHRRRGESAEAAAAGERSLALWLARGEQPNAAVLLFMTKLALVHFELGHFDEAERLCERALAGHRALSGEASEETAQAIVNLATLRKKQGMRTPAESLLLHALDIRRRLFDPGDPRILQSLRLLGEFHEEQDDHRKALPFYEELITALKHHGTSDKRAFARDLNNVATLYYRLGEIERSRPLYEEALALARLEYGENHLEVAVCEGNLANVLRDLGDFDAAERLTRHALSIRRAVLADQHPDIADLGNPSATGTMGQSLALLQLAHGAQDARYANAMVRLAQMELSANHLDVAEGLAAKAVEIARAANAGGTVAHGNVVLANLAARRGDITTAETLYQSALASFQESSPQSWDTASLSRDLAILYLESGREQRALPLLERAVDIAAATHGPRSAQCLYITLIKAQTLSACHRLAEATDLYRRVGEAAAAIGRQDLGGRAYLYTGELYLKIGADAAAEAMLTKALELLKPSQSEQQAQGRALIGIAVVYSRKQAYDEALAWIEAAIALVRSLPGPVEIVLAEALSEKAWILARAERLRQAFDCLVEATTIIEEITLQAFAPASEHEREVLAGRLYGELDVLLTLALRLNTPDVAATTLDRVLRWKGIVLEWTALQAASLSRGEQAEVAVLRAERLRVRSDMAVGALGGVPEDRASNLSGRYEALDAELSKRTTAVVARMRPRATSAAVVRALSPDLALAEYVRFEVVDFALGHRATRFHPGRARYAAFVLLPSTVDEPRMFDLGDAEDIDTAIRSLRSWITTEEDPPGTPASGPWVNDAGVPLATAPGPPVLSSFDEYRQSGRKLRRLLLDPILAEVGGCTNLCVAPHGDLARLPFAALAFDDDGYVIDRYDISFVNSGRDLLRDRDNPQTSSPALVIADPDFDLALADVPAEHRRAPFSHLEGTRAEGQAIAALLGVQPVMTQEAVKARVLAARSPRILHLATHGFFLVDDRPPLPGNVVELVEMIEAPGFGKFVARMVDKLRAVDEGPPVDRFTRIGRLANPLLRSGIALAGANTWVSEGVLPPGAGNGLLTADEICSLDFQATELAVLSACETGLGEIRGGEGVYGLRRAFAMAGVRTLVMSLWKVPDQQTKALMIAFFRRVCAGEPCSQALRSAQLEVRDTNPYPVFWASFVCVGVRSAVSEPVGGGPNEA